MTLMDAAKDPLDDYTAIIAAMQWLRCSFLPEAYAGGGTSGISGARFGCQ
jgi:hypothetical protein